MAQTLSPAPPVSASGTVDCTALPPVLERDGADWRRPARVFRASPRPDAGVAVSLRERVSLTLGSVGQTPLVVQPGSSERAAEDGYRGFVAWRTGKAGDYRVSLDDRAWLEVIAQGAAQPSVVTFSDKRLACFGVVKNLTFALRADMVYFIQILAQAGRASVFWCLRLGSRWRAADARCTGRRRPAPNSPTLPQRLRFRVPGTGDVMMNAFHRMLLGFVALCAILLAQPPAMAAEQVEECAGGYAERFRLAGQVEQRQTFTLSDLRDSKRYFPSRVEVSYFSGREGLVTKTYIGVPLLDLLNEAKIVLDPNRRNDRQRKWLLVTASDCYQSVLALAELLPNYGGQHVLIAYADGDGNPLPADEGMARRVVPGDKQGGRLVSNIARITVRSAP